MAEYIFKTAATMKSHNSKNWWIDRDIITEKRIKADNANQALTIFAELVEEKHYVSISKTALKNKAEMYRDTASTVIIASKRKGKKLWEGYTEVLKASHKEELSRRRSMGRVCKVFADMNAYRADINRILDKSEGR